MIRMNEILYARMINMLTEGCTAHDVAYRTGLHIVTAQSYLRALHKEKVVYVMGWVKNSRGADTTKIYRLGKEQDKPREVLTRAEIAARYKFKQRLRKQMQRERSIMEGARM